MCPYRQPFIMEVAQQPVELGVPVVEVAHIGGLECTALQLESQHDVAGIERNHVLIQMQCVRQEFGWVGLSLRHLAWHPVGRSVQIGKACCREKVWRYGEIWGVAVYNK